MYNENFDPLSVKYIGTEEVVIKSLKREIKIFEFLLKLPLVKLLFYYFLLLLLCQF